MAAPSHHAQVVRAESEAPQPPSRPPMQRQHTATALSPSSSLYPDPDGPAPLSVPTLHSQRSDVDLGTCCMLCTDASACIRRLGDRKVTSLSTSRKSWNTCFVYSGNEVSTCVHEYRCSHHVQNTCLSAPALECGDRTVIMTRMFGRAAQVRGERIGNWTAWWWSWCCPPVPLLHRVRQDRGRGQGRGRRTWCR